MEPRAPSPISPPAPLSPELEAETDRRSGTVVRGGCGVLFLPSGSQSYEQRWALIESAQRSVDLVTFSMMRDGTSTKLLDLLRRKIAAGVRVRLIIDDAVLYTTFMGGALEALAKAGAEVRRYHRVFRDLAPEYAAGSPFKQMARTVKVKMKRRFHEKYTIVDGDRAILGGINWGDKYAYGGIKPKAWRDTDVLLTGPVVGDVQRQFERDFSFYTAMEEEPERRPGTRLRLDAYMTQAFESAREIADELAPTLPAPTGAERVRYVPHKPYDEQKLRMTEAVLLLIKSARRYIYWGCHGIRPPRILAESLAEAVARGVEVRLVSNSQVSSRTLMFFGLAGWMYWESSNHFPWLLEHGIRLFEWQKPGAFHSKNLVIDDEVASVGSFNVASGSTFHHTESNVVVYGGEFPLAVRRQFEVDLQDCKELLLPQARAVPERHQPMRRPLHERNLLIPRELRTEAINADLDAGRYKRM